MVGLTRYQGEDRGARAAYSGLTCCYQFRMLQQSAIQWSDEWSDESEEVLQDLAEVRGSISDVR